MGINWDQLGQPRFDRVIEALVKRRYRDCDVRAVDGRGGDGGLDIEVVAADGRLTIMQLKYFPGGFSGGHAKTRRAQIKESFKTAQQRQPDEWKLVVPSVVTDTESVFVHALAGDVSDGRGPKVGVIDRDELDDWLADDPELDKYFQRDPTTTLAEFARDFSQEKAALLGGTDDLASRISNLGSVTDTLDPDWTIDFSRVGDGVQMAVRPQHPKAAETNPIRLSLELAVEDNSSVARELERSLEYGGSHKVNIRMDSVGSISFSGPSFLSGPRAPSDVFLRRVPTKAPGVGKPLEIRILSEDNVPVSSWVGPITYAAKGNSGGTIEAAFVEGHVEAQFLIPDEVRAGGAGCGPGVTIGFSTGETLPSVTRDVLRIVREIRTASKMELYVDGVHATTVAAVAPMPPYQYDEKLLIVEQYADDLHEVQQRIGSYFNMPVQARSIDRIMARVGRILLEGGIVAAPDAQVFNLVLSGADSEQLREWLCNTGQFVHLNRDPYEIQIDGRNLSIGPVYVLHPEAFVENVAEAMRALDTEAADGFLVRIKPANDKYFYLALADRSLEEHYDQPFYAWGLIGITQPDLPAATETDQVNSDPSAIRQDSENRYTSE